MNFSKAYNYDKNFIDENMMGPNSLLILEELMENVHLKEGSRVLDLGCGRGLTSVFLAKEYGVNVFAVDLWTSATENLARFKSLVLDDLIVPLCADALNMPFADGYFDAVVSVDAYHYVGNNDTFFTDKIKPLLKKGALTALAFPGMKNELYPNIPNEMAPYWDDDCLSKWRSIDWWKPKFESHLSSFNIWEMGCFDKAWEDWLSTGNPYAIEDRAMMKADGGKYMNLIGITGIIK